MVNKIAKELACETLEAIIKNTAKDKSRTYKILGVPLKIKQTRGGIVSIKVGDFPLIKFDKGTAIGTICEIAIGMI